MPLNNGNTWTVINTGLPNNWVRKLVVNNGNIYAGTETIGVWKLQISDTIITSVNQISGGTTSGNGIYLFNQLCTDKAIPNLGYYFVNWTENGNIVSLDLKYTFTVTSNRNLVANFSLLQGINELISNCYIIHPNPATNKIILDLQQLKNLQNTTVTIYDIQGKLLLQQAILQPQTELNISSYAKGVYVVKVSNDMNSIVSKFVKD
jgi:hypothetical protein